MGFLRNGLGAELVKVPIECESRFDLDFLDYDLTRTIGETPTGVELLPTKDPIALDLLSGKTVPSCQQILKNSLREFSSAELIGQQSESGRSDSAPHINPHPAWRRADVRAMAKGLAQLPFCVQVSMWLACLGLPTTCTQIAKARKPRNTAETGRKQRFT